MPSSSPASSISTSAIKERFLQRFPALASRDFLIFWTGQALSLIGTWMQSTTLPYLAYRISGRPIDLGIIGFSSTLPSLLLSLPAGVFVERLNKRKMVIVLQAIMMVQAITLAFLTLTGRIQIWHIIILAFILGSANAIEITARQAMLIELVGKPALPNAIALQTTIMNLARVLGPSITALVLILVANNGEGWSFMINAISFLFVIIGLFFARTPFQVQNAKTSRNLVKEFMEGQRYIRQDNTVSTIIILATMVGFFGFPFIQQMPVFARDVLSQVSDPESVVKAHTSTLYMAQGVGALVAALFVSFNSTFKRKGLLMTIGQVVFSVMLLGISVVKNMTLALPAIAILGWAMVIQLVLMNTLIQINVPDHLRGRVSAHISGRYWGSRPSEVSSLDGWSRPGTCPLQHWLAEASAWWGL
jgi:MFS family permease